MKNRTARELNFMGMNALMKAMLRGWKVDDWFYWFTSSGWRLQAMLVYKDNGDECKTVTMIQL